MTNRRTPPIRVTYAYKVPYLPRTCTEGRTASFAAETDVSFRIVEEAEAPVAFRIADPRTCEYERTAFRPKPDGTPRSIRWHANQFWLEWGPVEDMARLLTERTEAKETPFAHGIDVRPFTARDVPDARGRLLKSPPDIQTMRSLKEREGVLKSIRDDGGAEGGAAIRAAAEGCIVVDGILYEGTPEPCLVVDGYYGHVIVTPVPDANRVLTFGGFHAMGGRDRFFRLDALPDAMREARKNKFDRKAAWTPLVEILRPDLVGAEPDLGHVMRECNDILKNLGKVAEHLPRGFVGKASAFAQVLADAPRFPTPALADAVEALAGLPPLPPPPTRRIPLRQYQRDERAAAYAAYPGSRPPRPPSRRLRARWRRSTTPIQGGSTPRPAPAAYPTRPGSGCARPVRQKTSAAPPPPSASRSSGSLRGSTTTPTSTSSWPRAASSSRPGRTCASSPSAWSTSRPAPSWPRPANSTRDCCNPISTPPRRASAPPSHARSRLMRLDLSFEYEVSFTPPRHRNPQTVASLGTTTIEIPEAGPGTVSVLHEIVSTFSRDGYAGPYAAPSRGRPCRVVEFEGRLYVEGCRVTDLAALASDRSPEASGSPFHVGPRGNSYRHMLTLDRHDGKPTGPVDVDALLRKHGAFRPGTFNDDGGVAKASLLQARASELLVYDGAVFAPTSEPVLAIVREPIQETGGWRLCVVPMESRAGGWSAFERHRTWMAESLRSEVFSLDRKEDAAAYAERLAALAGETFVDAARIHAVSSGDLDFGGTWPAAKAARAIVWELRDKVLSLEPSVAEAWAGVRDATDRFPGPCSAATLAALDAFCAAVAEHGLPWAPTARDCARLAVAGERDLDVETRTVEGCHGLVHAVHAYHALGRSERQGLSWARRVPAVDEMAWSEGISASEILSTHDAARVAEGLGTTLPSRTPPVGGRIAAVARGNEYGAEPLGLVCLYADGSEAWSVGPGGHPPAPHVVRLAREAVRRRGRTPSTPRTRTPSSSERLRR